MKNQSGFSLVEVTAAVMILSIVGIGMSRVLRSQNQFFDQQTNQRAARSVARGSLNIMTNDLRMVQDSSGVDSVSSDGKYIRIKVPYRFGLVCSATAAVTTVSMLPADAGTLATTVYAGFAWRNATTGRYVYVEPNNPTGSDLPALLGSTSTCTGTASGEAQIKTLTMVGPVTGTSRTGELLTLTSPASTGATVAAPVFFWQKVAYSFKTSGTFSGYYGLYREVQGGAAEEIMAPFDATARFRYYQAGDDTSRTTVPAKGDIRGVDLVLTAISPRATSNNATHTATTKMVTSVMFKNVRSY